MSYSSCAVYCCLLLVAFLLVSIHGQEIKEKVNDTLYNSILNNLKPELLDAKPRAKIAVRKLEDKLGKQCELNNLENNNLCNDLIDDAFRISKSYNYSNKIFTRIPTSYPNSEMELVTGQSLVIGDRELVKITCIGGGGPKTITPRSNLITPSSMGGSKMILVNMTVSHILWFSNYNVAVYSGNFQMIQPVISTTNGQYQIAKIDILKLAPANFFKKVYRIKKRKCGPYCRNMCPFGRIYDEEGCPTCGCKAKPKI